MSKVNIVMHPFWFDWYKDPKDIKSWKECPVCNYKPKIWEFDNGRFAQCACAKDYSRYAKLRVEHESIGELLRRTNGNASEYDSDGLRKAWNKHVEVYR